MYDPCYHPERGAVCCLVGRLQSHVSLELFIAVNPPAGPCPSVNCCTSGRVGPSDAACEASSGSQYHMVRGDSLRAVRIHMLLTAPGVHASRRSVQPHACSPMAILSATWRQLRSTPTPASSYHAPSSSASLAGICPRTCPSPIYATRTCCPRSLPSAYGLPHHPPRSPLSFQSTLKQNSSCPA